jgi:hypothetical protein
MARSEPFFTGVDDLAERAIEGRVEKTWRDHGRQASTGPAKKGQKSSGHAPTMRRPPG